MIEELIRRARRRIVLNVALGQLAFALACATAGFVLLLLAGTRYLEWWSVAVFAIAGAAIAVARGWQAAPDAYSTAVQLDRNAGLHDALSTAFYFSNHRCEYPESLDAQRREAEQAARTVDLETAVPFTLPRQIYVLAAIAVFASLVTGIRYHLAGRLDLRAPITQIVFEDLAAQAGKKGAAGRNSDRGASDKAESLLAKLGLAPDPQGQNKDAALDKAIDQALETASDANQKGPKGASDGMSQEGKATNGKTPDGDPLDGKPSDKQDESADAKQGREGNGTEPSGAKNGSGENSSLMSRLKDAVSNLFSKSKQDNSAMSKGEQNGQAAKADKSNGEKNGAAKGQEKGQSAADAQEGEASSDAQEGQQAQGKAGAKSAQQSAQAGSGVGNQDGAKDLKAAEQLKAMGKISEIIGKRAATVTGETSIEVQSGNQQLRTAYSKSAATHGEAASDLGRDEIPVSLQPYIQQYFEQIRKSRAGETTPARRTP